MRLINIIDNRVLTIGFQVPKTASEIFFGAAYDGLN
jgi:hypothetical protein